MCHHVSKSNYSNMNKVTPEDRRKIKSWVRKCMNLLKKKDYPLNITRSDVDYAV